MLVTPPTAGAVTKAGEVTATAEKDIVLSVQSKIVDDYYLVSLIA
jgi:hypothetical protein